MSEEVFSARHQMRKTLSASRKEAVSSAVSTSICDNFFIAFALFLQASLLQIAWLTAVPQLIGGWLQIASVWLGQYVPRRNLILTSIVLQAASVFGYALLAIFHPQDAFYWLLGLALAYQATSNLIQPLWRAWMGGLIPPRRRGAFFAGRTRLTMLTTVIMFCLGGGLLNLFQASASAWIGFCTIFLCATLGRVLSAKLTWQMHDPEPDGVVVRSKLLMRSIGVVREATADPVFRRYVLFMAGFQGCVAISGPFFAVYMLSDLGMNYLTYSIALMASILAQFVTLGSWGKISDRYGNRVVMVITCSIIPVLPLLWLISANFFYLIVIQLLSGFAWSGFSLCGANYLYDLRPRQANFATYAALQSGVTASAVFVGVLIGGYLAVAAESWADGFLAPLNMTSSLYVVFVVTAVLRIGLALWFLPNSVEPRVRHRPRTLEIVYRIARFNSVSGVVLDLLSVVPRPTGKSDKESEEIK